MGKLLAAGAIVLAIYALYDTQKPGSRLRLTSGSVSLPNLNATSGGSIGAAAVGAAGRVGN
ncbi:MAG: hypothetical protein OEY05_07860 [Paracoccaceae bacterium]|jgi:hypothetical protein|nr:hypothetical protein [Paracoccaceae bacterium]